MEILLLVMGLAQLIMQFVVLSWVLEQAPAPATATGLADVRHQERETVDAMLTAAGVRQDPRHGSDG